MMNMMYFTKAYLYYSFYDKHEKNGVTALYQVSDEMENRLQEQYGAPSKSLEKVLNYRILISLMQKESKDNYQHSKSISDTARKHSQDMVENSYFDHTDLNEKHHLTD